MLQVKTWDDGVRKDATWRAEATPRGGRRIPAEGGLRAPDSHPEAFVQGSWT